MNAPGRARWWALVILDLALLAITIDNTIMNVALPTLARQFRATGSELQWIVDACRDAIGSQFAALGPTLEATAKDSIGAASMIAHSLPGDAGAQVVRIAGDAFMSGMSGAMVIGAVVVAAASAVIFAWLPARAPASDELPAVSEHYVAADLAAAD